MSFESGQVLSLAAFVSAALCFAAAGWLVHSADGRMGRW